MTETTLESDWAKLGVLFSTAPSSDTPDIERLLLRTARAAPRHARLVTITATWLLVHGHAVARHRLRRLVASELEHAIRPVLAFIIDSALRLGATKRLSIVLDACAPAAVPGPLHELHRVDPRLRTIAQRNACPISTKWGVWFPTVTPKHDVMRPVTWVRAANPAFHARAVRQGDLRCSIVETLRLDACGVIASEHALARLSGATRAGLRKALDALAREGEILRPPRFPGRRDRVIRLATGATVAG